MKAPNHIVGGICFTGFFASLWNINIFQSADTLVFTAIACILPDIDHTRSLIGKAFYPFARWIDKKWGHRTITHSLIFITLISFIFFILEKHFSDNYTYSTILFFAIFSHYILDMLTVQGIPLFYPFFRNPCVIPGRPTMRISSNDNRAELIAFSLFVLVSLSSFDLYKNGFWTTYNRMFGTIKHLHQENINTDNFLLCEYDYIKNGKNYKGLSYVLNTSEYEAVLFDNQQVFTLSKNNDIVKINEVKPVPTNHPKTFQELGFFNIPYDSLQSILSNRIVSGQIQSSEKFNYVENNITKTTSLLKLDHSYDFRIYISHDSTDNIKQKIKVKQLKINQQKLRYESKAKEINEMTKHLNYLEKKVDQTNNLYLKDKYQNQIMELKKEIQVKETNLGIYKKDPILQYEIAILKQKQKINKIRFSGLIIYPVLPENILK